MNIHDTHIDYLKSVVPNRADILKKELQVLTYGDLLHHYPFRYIDRSIIYKIEELSEEMPFIQLKGKIISLEEKGHKKSKRLVAYFKDETGVIELVWFKGIRWIKSGVKLNTDYIIFGKPSFYKGVFNIVHPELDIQNEKQDLIANLQSVYHSTELLNAKGLTSRAIGKLTKALLLLLNKQLQETLSVNLVSRLNLPTREEALFSIHYPKDTKALIRAQKRLKFEEFFFLQLHLLKIKSDDVELEKT